jgi:hypothetical protein
MADFIVVQGSSENKKNYQYLPLVDNKGNFLRAYYNTEMTRVIEISESAYSPEKTNAKDIPAFLFFDSNNRIPYALQTTIPENINKYYCRLESYKEHKDDNGKLTGNYPDNPLAFRNIISVHLATAMKDLQEKNHPLPMTLVYQIGMNNNHTGTVAIRINNLTDPSKNEIMVINSLSGYRQWENAAIDGLSDVLKFKASEANKEKKPKTILITPEQHAGITQSSSDMRASCSAITAAMSCAISPDLSFADQEEKLVNHMRTLCGKENEVLLRRDHEKLLALPHPLDTQFNPDVTTDVLRQCKKHQKILTTPEDFLKAMTSREVIQKAQIELKAKGKTLCDICSAVKNPTAVRDMFMNMELMNAIAEEGTKGRLIEKHKQIYTTMWPSYSSFPLDTVNKPKITTPEDVVKAMTDKDKIKKGQDLLKKEGSSLFSLCSQLKNPEAIKNMFMNTDLMDILSKEGNKEKLIAQHKEIYTKMWPNYSSFPIMKKSDNDNVTAFKSTLSQLKNNAIYPELMELKKSLIKEIQDLKLKCNKLKTEQSGCFSSSESAQKKAKILSDFMIKLDKVDTVDGYYQTIKDFTKTDEYKFLSNARGIGYQMMGWKATSGALIDNLQDAVCQHVDSKNRQMRM